MGQLFELSPSRACFCWLIFIIFLFLLAVVGLLLLLRAKKDKINKEKLLNDVQLPFSCYISMLAVQSAPQNLCTQLHRLKHLYLNVTVITLAEAC